MTVRADSFVPSALWCRHDGRLYDVFVDCGGLAQTIFLPYTINYTYMMLAVAVLLVGGLVCRRGWHADGSFCGVPLGARS